jgi:ketosteroid isomerase-like protein
MLIESGQSDAVSSLVPTSCIGHPFKENAMKTAREAIVEGYKAFERAFSRGDADAVSQMYTDDAEWLVPEAPIVRGRKAIAEVWKSIIGVGGNTIRVDVGEVEQNGDWAYEVGSFTASAPDGSVLNAGKYIVIWKRQSNGAWKTHRDIFNWDVPPGKPANA